MNKTFITNKISLVGIVFALAFAITAIAASDANADEPLGWTGSTGGGISVVPSSGSSSVTTTGCAGSNSLDCTGWVWMYFAIEKENQEQDLIFPLVIGNYWPSYWKGTDNEYKISKLCSRRDLGYTGFYILGRAGQGNNKSGGISYLPPSLGPNKVTLGEKTYNYNATSTYYVEKGKWGLMDVYVWKSMANHAWAREWYYLENVRPHGAASMVIKNSSDTPVYEAKGIEAFHTHDDEMWDDFVAAYNEEHKKDGITWTGERGTYPDDLYAFCAGKGNAAEPENETYQGTIEVSVNGTTRQNNQTIYLGEGSQTASVSFQLGIKRTDKGETEQNTYWWATNSTNNHNTFHSQASPGATAKLKGGSQVTVKTFTENTKSILVEEGKSVKVCQANNYWKTIERNDDGSVKSHVDDLVDACITLTTSKTETPIPSSANAGVDVKVVLSNGQVFLNKATVPTIKTDGEFTIYWRHWFVREEDHGGDYHGGDRAKEVSSDSRTITWKTTATGTFVTNNNKNMDTGKGTSRPATGTTFTKGEKKILVDFTEETWTGTLYPGEKRKFCQKIEGSYDWDYYQARWVCDEWYHGSCIDGHYEYDLTDGGSPSASAERCVVITREDLTCSVDGLNTTYGVSKGKNIASMVVTNNTSEDSKTLNNNTTTGTIYAKPGDYIHYVYKSCAGGQPADDYATASATQTKFEYKGTNSTAAESNKKKYLFGSQFNPNLDPNTEIFGTSHALDYNNKVIGTNFTSPSNASYGCRIGQSTWYQVPSYNGWKDYSSQCRSAITVGRPYSPQSDVGSTITQTLKYPTKTVSGVGSINHNSTTTLTGNVVIPYNYDTQITTSNVNNAPITAGQQFEVNISVKFVARANKIVTVKNNTPYATHTKPTTIKTYYWIEEPGVSADYINNHVKGSGSEANGYYVTDGESPVAKDATEVISGYSGYSPGSIYDYRSNISIPFSVLLADNVGIGAKVCAAVAVNPADSHDNPGKDAGQLSQDPALNSTSNKWATSKPTCRTVGKKPTFAVTNGNLYAYGGVEATTFRRSLSGTQLTFSSMSQFSAASATSAIAGFATGASTWGGSPLDTTESTCNFSALTLANANCKKTDLASLGIVNLPGGSAETSPAAIVRKIKNRYIPDSSVLDSYDTKQTSTGSDTSASCKYNSELGVYQTGYETSSSSSNGTKFYKCLSDGMVFAYTSKGTFSYGTTSTSSGSWNYSRDDAVKNDATIIYVPNGTLYIKQNLYYGRGSLKELTTYSSLNSISQRIIIAKKIVIDPAVTNVSAWLIADEIDTCDESIKNIDVNKCNRQLTVNGPVITKKLTLKRTYGSGANIQSKESSDNADKQLVASPAEIFNIGPETYLWAYTQFTRTGQATTTYQRELAPRY